MFGPIIKVDLFLFFDGTFFVVVVVIVVVVVVEDDILLYNIDIFYNIVLSKKIQCTTGGYYDGLWKYCFVFCSKV